MRTTHLWPGQEVIEWSCCQYPWLHWMVVPHLMIMELLLMYGREMCTVWVLGSVKII